VFTTTVHTQTGQQVSDSPAHREAYSSAAEALAAEAAIPGYAAALKAGWTIKVWQRRNVARHDGSRFYTAQVWVEVG
jgi:hypothetical protein